MSLFGPVVDETLAAMQQVPIFPRLEPLISANGYMIEDPAPENVSRWFSIKVAEETAAAHGWTDEPGKALQFARRQDAEDFARRYLPRMQVKVVGRNGG
jgi:hypothetical protein